MTRWLPCWAVVRHHPRRLRLVLRHLPAEALWRLVRPTLTWLPLDRVPQQEEEVPLLVMPRPLRLRPFQGAWVARNLLQHRHSALQNLVLVQLAGHVRVPVVLAHVVALLLPVLLAALQ